MLYEFKCNDCNRIFEIKRPMSESGDPVKCPVCGVTGQRVFSILQWIWGGSVYRPDGSRREQNDYAILKG